VCASVDLVGHGEDVVKRWNEFFYNLCNIFQIYMSIFLIY
jgi:hypothetical protein